MRQTKFKWELAACVIVLLANAIFWFVEKIGSKDYTIWFLAADIVMLVIAMIVAVAVNVKRGNQRGLLMLASASGVTIVWSIAAFLA